MDAVKLFESFRQIPSIPDKVLERVRKELEENQAGDPPIWDQECDEELRRDQ